VVVKSAVVAVLKFLKIENVPPASRCCHWISGVPKLQLAVAVRWIGGPITADDGPAIVIVQDGTSAATPISTAPAHALPAASDTV
jgi:hypothetical protein